MNQYEAMFLFDPTFGTDLGDVKAEIQRILDRANAEVVFLEKWEERKLAYEIKGRKRGLYMLTYFRCDGEHITGIERDAQLSEPILRILVRRADDLTREDMERFLPQSRGAADDQATTDAPQPKPAAAPATESAPVAVATAPESKPAGEAPQDESSESDTKTGDA